MPLAQGATFFIDRKTETVSVKLTNTPAGRRLASLLDGLQDSDTKFPRLIAENFDPNFIRAVGSPEALANALRTFVRSFAPFTGSVQNDQSTPHSIVAELIRAERGPAILTCVVGEDDPHLIVGLGSQPKPLDISSLDDVESLLKHHDAPGVSAAVFSNGKVEWARAWGLADTATKTPLDPDTLLQCGSISKAVTALAALRLVDAGTLDLDADVNGYLRSWRVPEIGGWTPVVTVRNLLTHTAGLTVWGFPGYEPDGQIPTLVEVLDGKGNTPAIRSEALPGLMWRYSGGGYSVLQQAMVDVTGKTFPALMKELVLDPLKMTNSTFEQPLPSALHGRAACAHQAMRAAKGRWHVYPEMAAAGLWTTPSDLALFAFEIQSRALLSQPLAAEMITGSDIEPGMGLGLFLGGPTGKRNIGHGGGNHGFVASLVWTEDGALGMAVMSNSNEGGAAIQDLRRFLANDHGRRDLLPQAASFSNQAAEGMQRAVPIEHREPADKPDHLLEAYLGEYEVREGYRLSLKRTDAGLVLQTAGQNPLPLYVFSEKEWVSRAIDLRIELGEDNMQVHQLGRMIEADKLGSRFSSDSPFQKPSPGG